MSNATRKVDAVSVATPNGGIKLIAQPGQRPPPPGPGSGFGVPGGPARMQLVAAGPRSRHAFNTVCSLVLPAVISIHARRVQAGALQRRAQQNRTFEGGTPEAARNAVYENVGSGFIIDSRGYALTNHHVVARPADLRASVFGGVGTPLTGRGGRPGPGGMDLPVTVVAADPVADLALIKISGAPALPEAQLGDSPSVQLGDWVLAFGSPFGLEQTVTQGIISGKRQSLVVDGVPYGDMLQTDAPINLGSSGGPLVNLNAEVVGINAAIYGPNRVFSGTGFAIPVDRAKTFLARCSSVFERKRW